VCGSGACRNRQQRDIRYVEAIKKDVVWLGFKWDIEAMPPLTVS
jgi:glutamyl/glutaminyl-tRNA synthetase